MSQDQQPGAPGPGMSFTGVRRERKTKAAVKVLDALAKACITVGGIGTICAVALVCFFLVYKVVDLFAAGTIEPAGEPFAVQTAEPVQVATDEYRLMTAVLAADGRIRVHDLRDGTILIDESILPAAEDAPAPTAWSFAAGDSFAVGFADGTARIGTLGFEPVFLDDDAIPPALEGIAAGERVAHGRGIVERTPEGQLRQQTLKLTLGDPIDLDPGTPVELIDHLATEREKVVAAVFGDDSARVYQILEKKNLLTGTITYSADAGTLPSPPGRSELPRFLGVNGLGDNVYQVWDDGYMVRYNVRRLDAIALVESADLTPEPGRITAAGFLNGKSTLLLGTEHGMVEAWFKAERPGADAAVGDGMMMVHGHRLETGVAPVTSFGVSSRTRLLGVGHADGTVAVHNVTTEAEVVRTALEGGIATLDIAPKDDGLVALAGDRLHAWSMDPKHHEVSVRSLILPVHYESRRAPETNWQSSSGDDAFEPKFGLWPLVFGTLKATFYALLFGVPIALMAAIYTSEFLHPKAKSVVKPTVEMMASLPSVVLGFIGGIVIASVVEARAATMVLSIATVPIAMLLCARLWQLLPRTFALRCANWRFLPMLLLAVPLGALLAWLGSPWMEYWFFTVTTVDPATGAVLTDAAGEPLIQHDLKTWLSAEQPSAEGVAYRSSGIGGWMFILWPLSAVIVAYCNARYVAAPLRDLLADLGECASALVDLGRFALNLVAGLLLAVALSWAVGHEDLLGDPRTSETIGWMLLMAAPAAGAIYLLHARIVRPLLGDRETPFVITLGYLLGTVALALLCAKVAIGVFGELDSFVGTYIQRNALVVGFVMGFAIIPIIYTIAEDALSSVPTHLRSASLGCGATPWQTAVRVILPTAMSGVFSAIMIGLGRAVGETMIVLMATGNTPVESMNLFDGLRTLAANIAVELPEAPKESTHYLVLFLTALVLFAMTFVLNTVAEAVRQRFRKRAFEL